MENKIAAKIVSDAVKMSNSTREEGSAKAQEIIERALNDVRIFREENMRETEILRREILERKESVARLEVKKLALKAKQRVLDTAFARALEAVRALPKDKYLKIIEGMLASAEDGDVVKIAECDAKTVTAAFVKKTAEKWLRNMAAIAKYLIVSRFNFPIDSIPYSPRLLFFGFIFSPIIIPEKSGSSKYFFWEYPLLSIHLCLAFFLCFIYNENLGLNSQRRSP